MPWQLAASYSDFLFQFGALLRDPVYHGIQVPKGKGQPVLLVPGFLGGDWAMRMMAGWLNRIGYRAYLSGIDWNIDCPDRTSELLRWRLDYIARETDHPVVVVGHSLGGMLARFLGVNVPERVRHVVTIGSPINSSIQVHPLVSLVFRSLQTLRGTANGAVSDCGSLRCTCQFAQAVFSPLPQGVGLTAIFSKQDEIVDWRSCLDPQGENREVSGRHVGLIVNKEVYRILASTLATPRQATRGPEDQWKSRSDSSTAR